MSWNDLSMSDRASYIKLGINNGITDLNTIREVYNKFEEGGPHERNQKALGGNLFADEDDNTPLKYDLFKTVEVSPEQQAERLISLGNGVYKDKVSDILLYKEDEMPGATIVGHKKEEPANNFDWAELATSMIPIYGTYKEVKNLVQNPSWGNAGWAALSLASELPMLKGLKGLKATKAIKTLKEAPLLTRSMNKGLKRGTSDLLYHLDYGDEIGAFSKQGAYIKGNKLVPGKAKDASQLDYTWFNEGKPYTTSVNGEPLNRAIIVNKKDVPNLIRVRESKVPIGQWNGKAGFVKKSEMVTSSEVPLDNAYIYTRKNLPILGEFWLRNLYGNGGNKPRYKSSSSIRKQISTWEGETMKTNTPFDKMDIMFNQVLPKGGLEKLSQEQLDGLYSFAYNVGTGRFKTRTAPTLAKYLQGNATIEDVKNTMWASLDRKYRGLANRRKKERSMLGTYVPIQETTPMTTPIDTPLATPMDITPAFQPTIESNPVIQDNIETPPLAFNIESQEESNYTPGFFDYVNYINQIRQPKQLKQRDRRIWLTI